MIHFRATTTEEASWTSAAGHRGLSQWIRQACEAQLAKELDGPVMTVHLPPKPGACARHGLVDCGICGTT